MALKSSKGHEKLMGVSGGTKRKSAFKMVYITGQQRQDETINTIQVVKDWSGKVPERLLENQEKINMILMFIKRAKQNTIKDDKKDKTVCFSYNEKVGAVSSSGRECPAATERDNGFCNTCRFQIIFAGALLEKGKIMQDEDGNPILIYFKNKGMKYSPAQSLLDDLQDQASKLKPIYDDPEFEQAVVTPRRFVIEVSVGQRESAHGTKNVFEYNPIKQLPDALVTDIIEKSEAYLSAFDSQFNITSAVGSDNGESGNSASGGGKSAGMKMAVDDDPFGDEEGAGDLGLDAIDENMSIGDLGL